MGVSVWFAFTNLELGCNTLAGMNGMVWQGSRCASRRSLSLAHVQRRSNLVKVEISLGSHPTLVPCWFVPGFLHLKQLLGWLTLCGFGCYILLIPIGHDSLTMLNPLLAPVNRIYSHYFHPWSYTTSEWPQRRSTWTEPMAQMRHRQRCWNRTAIKHGPAMNGLGTPMD